MKTVVFDFDGVIHSYTSGWQGATVIADAPVEGIREAIASIRAVGYEVAVVSTRCATPDGLRSVKQWLAENDIDVDKVCAEKPPAVVYIDDRAICFDGDTVSLLDKIESFQPWYQKAETTVDAVEVVRCKDCKYYKKFKGFRGAWCHRWLRKNFEFMPKPNDFCSFGKRKESE